MSVGLSVLSRLIHLSLITLKFGATSDLYRYKDSVGLSVACENYLVDKVDHLFILGNIELFHLFSILGIFSQGRSQESEDQ